MDGSRSGLPAGVPLDDKWERTFDAVPDLIMILDTQHRVVRANRALAERLGQAPEDLIGRTCHELIHGANAPVVSCPHSKLICNGEGCSTEVSDERRGGTFLVSVSPLHDLQGRLIGSVHVARDITRQKRAEAEARKAVQQTETFLAMLSHELRNPLGAILNAAYIVKRAPAKHGSFQEALAVIERQAVQMSFLLDDLLDISRVMQGKIEMRHELVDLSEILPNAINVVQAACRERGQQLEAQIPATRLTVLGDPARLQQVHVNLLANASKYTPAGGHISLAVARQGNDIVVRVRDDGRGIPPEKLESIFELFVQADDSLDRQQGGMGIGLTLVQMLVQMHGGRVEAHSHGPGHGSEFVVVLPAAVSEPAPSEEDQPAPASAAASKVLIVEDNHDSRTMLQALLQLDGHIVRVAEDGVTGLETLQSDEFDVALIDIGLPGLDGYEVVRRYRSLGRKHAPRLVALTGYGRPSDRLAVMEAGFDEHLVKPCDPQDLDRILHCTR